MPTKFTSDRDTLTAFERYDQLALANNWVPVGLTDPTREHALAELRAAAKNCIPVYISLAHDLVCEIAWRETLQQMHES